MNIRIASYRRARERIKADEDFDALVSICTSTDGKSLISPWVYKYGNERPALLVEMYDVLPYRKKSKTYDGLSAELPTGNDILKIIEFSRSLPSDSNVLVHCAAGRSRSAAAGIIMLAATGMNVQVAVDTIFQGAPKSNPNGWMLKLADILLPEITQDMQSLFVSCNVNHKAKW